MEKKTEYRFQVKLAVKDFWQFSMYHATKGTVGLFGVIFTVAALFLLVTKWAEVDTSYRILLVVCAALFPIWQPGVLYWKARKQAALPVMQIPLTLQFDESGLTVQQKEETAVFAWDQIFRVVELPHLLVLYTDSIHAYLLPDAALGEEKEGFLAMIEEAVPKENRKKRKGFFL